MPSKKNKKTKKVKNSPRRPMAMEKRIHEFVVFTATPGGVSSINNTNLITESFWCISPKLSDLPGYANFTALFDQYRITRVEVEILPTAQPALVTGGTLGTARGCYLFTVVDNDDASVPASINEMRQYATAKVHANMSVVKRSFKPAVLVQAYESNVATAYEPKFNAWISTTDPATQQFGMKIGMYTVDSSNPTNTVIYIVGARYWVQCKNQK